MLSDLLNKFKNRVAIRLTSQSITYKTLMQMIDGGATYILKSGLDKNNIVGLTIKNEVEHLVATLSLMHLNIPHIVLASFESSETHEDVINRLGITHLLKDSDSGHKQDFTSWNIINLQDEKMSKYEINSVSMFLKTSGTTGRINLIPFSYEQIENQSSAYHWLCDETLMTLASIEHNNARRHRVFSILTGGTNVFIEQKENHIKTAIKHKVSLISGSHLHAMNLLKTEETKKLKNIKLFFSGSLIPSHVRSKIISNITPHLMIGYGATESGAVSFTELTETKDYESVGYPANGIEIQIVDSGNNVTEAGELGEIIIRSDGMAIRYHDNEEQTSRRFKNGWFYTGDIGKKTDDGKLVIKSRKDDMIILNGINIFPSEIEEILETHEDIITSAVVGLESLNHGSIPVAAIEISDQASSDVKKYLSFARQKLMLRSPRQIIIVDRLPRNAQGKILKKDLQGLFRK